jgi:hypothetical protein
MTWWEDMTIVCGDLLAGSAGAALWFDFAVFNVMQCCAAVHHAVVYLC